MPAWAKKGLEPVNAPSCADGPSAESVARSGEQCATATFQRDGRELSVVMGLRDEGPDEVLLVDDRETVNGWLKEYRDIRRQMIREQAVADAAEVDGDDAPRPGM